jgi:hypothetical protein
MAPENILDKVRKLLRLAGNNPNPEEAASAAAAAQRMLDAHNLSAAMLELETEAPPRPEEPIQDFGSGAVLGVVRDHATERLASVIARANGCRIYFLGGIRQGRRLCLVGRATDAEAARYLYAWVAAEMTRLAEAHGHGMGRVWRSNFKLGIVDTVGRKLREGREAMAAEAKATAAHNPHALMVVSTALAQLEQRSKSVEVWMKTNLKLRAGRASGARYDGSAREAGRRAGESIALRGGRPLASGAPRLGR